VLQPAMLDHGEGESGRPGFTEAAYVATATIASDAAVRMKEALSNAVY